MACTDPAQHIDGLCRHLRYVIHVTSYIARLLRNCVIDLHVIDVNVNGITRIRGKVRGSKGTNIGEETAQITVISLKTVYSLLRRVGSFFDDHVVEVLPSIIEWRF